MSVLSRKWRFSSGPVYQKKNFSASTGETKGSLVPGRGMKGTQFQTFAERRRSAKPP